ncbi:MAG: hypothetical protein FWG66_14715 [Spirochaetes bacterium]|nr:hypothetical protein [Spirochaetota bacterium]
MEKEFVFIKEKFAENLKQYKKHLRVFEKIDNYEIGYSSAYIDFFPYQAIMNGFKPATLHKNKPASNKNDNFIENRIKDNDIYYSYNGLRKEWGTEFYFTDEQNNKTRLYYTDSNEDDQMLLSQLYYKTMAGTLVEKVYCYMYDPDMEEETFYVFEYQYDNGNINKIIRHNYFYEDQVMTFDEKKLKIKK